MVVDSENAGLRRKRDLTLLLSGRTFPSPFFLETFPSFKFLSQSQNDSEDSFNAKIARLKFYEEKVVEEMEVCCLELAKAKCTLCRPDGIGL